MRHWLAIVVTIVVIAVACFAFEWPYEMYMQTRAVRLLGQIERYQAANGKYPLSRLDIAGASINGPIYYERDLESPEVYYLWFGTGFGTVSQYDSKTRTWHGPR